MEKLRSHITLILACVSLLSTVGGALFYVDSRYALAADLTEVKQKLTLMELEDLYKKALDNKYFYADQAKKYPKDEDIQKKLKEAEDEVSDLKEQIKKLKGDSK